MSCSMDNRDILSAVVDTYKKIKEHGYEGYDPADLMNTQYGLIRKLPNQILRLLTLLNFYSPINFRKLLRISPTVNTSAMVVFGKTCLKLYQVTGEEEYLKDCNFFYKWLMAHSIRHSEFLGWSRVLGYQASSSQAHQKDSTLTYIDANAGQFFLDFYKITGNPEFLDSASRVCRHLQVNTEKFKIDNGICLSYSEKLRLEVPNASILAGSLLNQTASATADRDFLRLSYDILNYTLSIQNHDGSWYYSYKNGKGKKQFDFHQTYMLDGIKSYQLFENEQMAAEVDMSFNLGCRYYLDKLFGKDGLPYWRYPFKYPTDIHNVSHAIYFFSRYLGIVTEATEMLEKLIKICFNIFYNQKNCYFYYQEYPFITAKHNFMRWGNAWTCLALSEYLATFI